MTSTSTTFSLILLPSTSTSRPSSLLMSLKTSLRPFVPWVTYVPFKLFDWLGKGPTLRRTSAASTTRPSFLVLRRSRNSCISSHQFSSVTPVPNTRSTQPSLEAQKMIQSPVIAVFGRGVKRANRVSSSRTLKMSGSSFSKSCSNAASNMAASSLFFSCLSALVRVVVCRVAASASKRRREERRRRAPKREPRSTAAASGAARGAALPALRPAAVAAAAGASPRQAVR
mmetsp:Transcript_53485/g.148264  ORF Transcript_53485/g.148264 Transcript_53485/m.148264 type:complete len:228 (+) Transcript_53485:235-918(+)